MMTPSQIKVPQSQIRLPHRLLSFYMPICLSLSLSISPSLSLSILHHTICQRVFIYATTTASSLTWVCFLRRIHMRDMYMRCLLMFRYTLFIFNNILSKNVEKTLCGAHNHIYHHKTYGMWYHIYLRLQLDINTLLI